MEKIRPFIKDDIPQVADLHQRVFGMNGGPACNLVDAIAARKLPHRFSHLRPKAEAKELNVKSLLLCMYGFMDTRALWPVYDSHSLNCLLETIARKTQWGDLHILAIYNIKGEMLGWYIYHLKPGGVSNLLQIMAKKTTIEEVLDQLFYDAWKQGSLAVTGRLEPQFIHVFSNKRCLFNCGTHWVLIHSRDPDLLRTIHYGDAFLSILEGEWCMRFGVREENGHFIFK